MLALALAAFLLVAALLPAFAGVVPAGDTGVRSDGATGGGTGEGVRPPEGIPLGDLLRALADLGLLEPGEAEPAPPERTPARPPAGGSESGGDEGPRLDAGAIADLLRALFGLGNGNGGTTEPEGTRIVLLDEPTPGQTVRVLVVQDGQPARGVPVRFNGEPVGTTGPDGVVTGEVPYAERLVVAAGDQRRTAGGTGRTESSSLASAPAATGALVAVPAPLPWAPQQNSPDGEGANATTETALPTEIDVDLRGTVAPGERVTVVARLDGSAVRDAVVRVDGEPVGTTDADGRLPYTLGRVRFATVSVERGAAGGSRRVAVEPVNVSVEGVALPTRPVTVRVTERGAPVEGATVAVGGESVGTTSPNGTVRARLPVANSVTVAATTEGGVRVATTLGGLLLPVGLAVLGVGVVLGGGRLLARRVDRPDGLLSGTRERSSRLSERLLALLVAGADRLEAAAGRLLAALSDGLAGLSRLVRSAVRRLAAPWGWLVRRYRRLIALLGTVPFETGADPGSAAGAEAAAAPSPAVDGSEGSLDARERIRAAWRELLSAAGVQRRPDTTAGEAAAAAVTAGLSADAVETVLSAFRAVEYGDADPSGLLDGVAAALEQVRGTTEEDRGGDTE